MGSHAETCCISCFCKYVIIPFPHIFTMVRRTNTIIRSFWICRPSFRPNNRWIHCRVISHFVAMDGMDHFDHVRPSTRNHVPLPARDLRACSSQMESPPAPPNHRRQSLPSHFRDPTAFLLRSGAPSLMPTISHDCPGAHHHTLDRISHRHLHAAIRLPGRLLLHFRGYLSNVSRYNRAYVPRNGSRALVLLSPSHTPDLPLGQKRACSH